MLGPLLGELRLGLDWLLRWPARPGLMAASAGVALLWRVISKLQRSSCASHMNNQLRTGADKGNLTV